MRASFTSALLVADGVDLWADRRAVGVFIEERRGEGAERAVALRARFGDIGDGEGARRLVGVGLGGEAVAII